MRSKNGGNGGTGVYMGEGTTSRVTAAERPYGKFYGFYSVSPENFGSTHVLRSFEEPIICQSPRRDILDLKLHSYTVLYVKTTLIAIKSHHLRTDPLKKRTLKTKVRKSRTDDFGHKQLDPRVTSGFEKLIVPQFTKKFYLFYRP